MRETITTEQKGRRSLEKNWTLVASAERDGVGLLGVWRTGGGDWKVKKKGVSLSIVASPFFVACFFDVVNGKLLQCFFSLISGS
ncbi:hypothetical protein HN873_020271 [Arachis hypogaea]